MFSYRGKPWWKICPPNYHFYTYVRTYNSFVSQTLPLVQNIAAAVQALARKDCPYSYIATNFALQVASGWS